MTRSIKGTLNTVELLGWLGGDPEMRFLASGTPTCRLRIATKRYGGQDDAGNQVYETEWVTVEVWERLAELCNSVLHKGSRVRVSGALRSESWLEKESNKPRTRTFVRAYEVMFLDARPGMPSEAIAASEIETEEVPF